MSKIQKNSKFRVVSTVLGMALLVGGLGMGIILVEQPQLLEQHAQVNYVCPTDAKCVVGKYACHMTGGNRSDICIAMPAVNGCPAYTTYKLADDCNLKVYNGQPVICDDRRNAYGYIYGTRRCTYYCSNVYYKANYYCSTTNEPGASIHRIYSTKDELCPSNRGEDVIVKTCTGTDECFEGVDKWPLKDLDKILQMYPGGVTCVPKYILDLMVKLDAQRP